MTTPTPAVAPNAVAPVSNDDIQTLVGVWRTAYASNGGNLHSSMHRVMEEFAALRADCRPHAALAASERTDAPPDLPHREDAEPGALDAGARSGSRDGLQNLDHRTALELFATFREICLLIDKDDRILHPQELAPAITRALATARREAEERAFEEAREIADVIADEQDVNALRAITDEALVGYRHGEEIAQRISAAIESAQQRARAPERGQSNVGTGENVEPVRVEQDTQGSRAMVGGYEMPAVYIPEPTLEMLLAAARREAETLTYEDAALVVEQWAFPYSDVGRAGRDMATAFRNRAKQRAERGLLHQCSASPEREQGEGAGRS